jgi:hypothetical protein
VGSSRGTSGPVVAASGAGPRVVAHCASPEPYGYFLPVFDAFGPADYLLYVPEGGVIGGPGFPAAGNISVVTPSCGTVIDVDLPAGADPFGVG